MMPLNFTFMFLYYTETASLTTLLMLYYRVVTLKKSGVLEYILGLCSLMIRQTNIIWANYFVIVVLIQSTKTNKSKTNSFNNKFIAFIDFIVTTIKSLPHIIIKHLWLVCLDLSFIGFLVWNKGSIVLGH